MNGALFVCIVLFGGEPTLAIKTDVRCTSHFNFAYSVTQEEDDCYYEEYIARVYDIILVEFLVNTGFPRFWRTIGIIKRVEECPTYMEYGELNQDMLCDWWRQDGIPGTYEVVTLTRKTYKVGSVESGVILLIKLNTGKLVQHVDIDWRQSQ